MYSTAQYRALWDFFRKGGREQYSSGEIIAALGGGMGKSTIYRQLGKLTEAGELRRFHQGKKVYYQYAGKNPDCENHFHLKCDICGRLIHLDCPLMSEVAGHIAETHGFAVDMGRTVLYGRCRECRRKEERR